MKHILQFVFVAHLIWVSKATSVDVITIVDAQHNLKDPDVRKVEFRNFVHADLNSKCNTKMATKWTIDHLDPQTFKHISFVPIENSDQTTVEMPSNLELGMYKFTIRVTTNVSRCFGKQSTKMDDFTYIRLEQSSLKVVSIAGKVLNVGVDSVAVSQKDIVQLQPGNASYYRRNGFAVNEKNFTKVEYYCRKINESYPMLYDDQIDDTNIVGTSAYNNLYENHTGGCFGKGPGKLAFNSNYASFKASELDEFNKVYEIRVDVSTNDNMYTGFIYVDFSLQTSASTATFHITPKRPEFAVQYDTGIQMNTQIDNVFIGWYKEGNTFRRLDEIKTLSWKWSIYGINDTISPFPLPERLDDLDLHSKGKDSYDLVIAPSFFNQYRFSRFGLKLESTKKDVVENMIFLEANDYPYEGSCEVKPNRGRSQDQFSITCSDWYDSDGIASYTVFTMEPMRVLSKVYWRPVDSEISLFTGDSGYNYYYSIYVNVTDNLGITTIYQTNDVQIVPPILTCDQTVSIMKDAIKKQRSYSMSGMLGSFADTLRIPVAKDDQGFCSNYCQLNEGCLSKPMIDCSVSRDADTIVLCQQEMYTCLADNQTQCLYCYADPDTNTTSCQLAADFDCSTIEDDKGRQFCIDETAACMDVLTNRNAKQSGEILSQAIRATSIHEMDIIQQTDALVDFLSAIGYETNVKGLTALNAYFKTVQTQVRSNLNHLPEAEQKMVIESVLKLSGAVTTCMGKLSRNPPIQDRIDASTASFQSYDSSVPLSPDDANYFEEYTPREFGTAVVKTSIKDMIVELTNSIRDTVKMLPPVVITLMNSQDSYYRTVVENAEILIVKGFIDRVLSNDSNVFYGENFEVVLPRYCPLIGSADCVKNESEEIAIVIVHLKSNIFQNSDNDNVLTTGSTDVDLFKAKSMEKVLVKHSVVPVEYYQKSYPPRNANPQILMTSANLGKLKSLMRYYEIHYVIPHSVLVINITRDDDEARMSIYLAFDRIPDLVVHDYDLADNMTENPYTLRLDESVLSNYVGTILIGITEYYEKNSNLTNAHDFLLSGDISSHTVETYSFLCRYFDTNQYTWSYDGCQVGEYPTAEMIHCKCDHMTTFAGGSIYPKSNEKSDFSSIFKTHSKNITIFIAIFVIFASWFASVIWAHFQDERDILQLGVTPLPDNDPLCGYFYEVIISTGFRLESATDSKIYFNVVGSRDSSGIHCMLDSIRKTFRRGQVNRFIMATPRFLIKCPSSSLISARTVIFSFSSLGNLEVLRIWHDNSGSGQYASWFLNHVTFIDLQTRDKFQFIANRWLAVEKDDGRICLFLNLSSQKEQLNFKYLFTSHFRRILTEKHIWLSVGTKPIESRFTRVQRACLCLLSVYTGMVASGMWFYFLVEQGTNENIVQLGPFDISATEILVGLVAPLLTMPLLVILSFLFRRTKGHKAQAMKTQEHLESLIEEQTLNRSREQFDYTKEGGGIFERGRIWHMRNLVYPRCMDRMHSKSYEDILLPWWFIFIAWFIWVVCFFGSVFMLIFLGVHFNDYMTRRWMTSVIVSILNAIFIIQPIKVLAVTIYEACIARRPIFDENEEDEVYVLSNNDNYVHDPKAPPRFLDPHIFNKDFLAHCRERRLKELKMYDIMREVLVNLLFFVVVAFIAYSSCDTLAPLYKQHLSNLMAGKPNDPYSMSKVKTVDEFWAWTKNRLVPNIRSEKWYNVQKPFEQRGFLSDRVSRLIGFATMRQIRSKPYGCQYSSMSIGDTMSKCSTEGYNSNWQYDTENYGYNWDIDAEQQDEFSYTAADQMQFASASGQLDSYDGGGYVVDLVQSADQMIYDLETLQSADWVDKRTRVIIVEFSAFNVFTQFFVFVQMMFEFTPSGGILTSYTIKPFSLFCYYDWTTLRSFCEVVFFIFMLIFTFKELHSLVNLGFTKYFQQFWNYVDFSIAIYSYIAIFIYGNLRLMEVSLTKMLEMTNGNVYINLSEVAWWHEYFNIIIALIVFLATVKFAKLFRFNFHMSILLDALHAVSGHLFWFGFMVVILFLAYWSFFYLSMSPDLDSIILPNGRTATGFSLLLGKMDFDGMYNISSVLGPIFYLLYIVTMTMVLVNLGVAIMMNITSTIRSDVLARSRDFELTDRMIDKFRLRLGKSRKYERMPMSDQYHNKITHLDGLNRRVDLLCMRVNVITAHYETDNDRVLSARTDIKTSD